MRESLVSHHETPIRSVWVAGRVIERGWAERNNHLDRIDHTALLSDFPLPPSPPRSHRRRSVGIRWHLIDGVEKSAKQDEVKIAARPDWRLRRRRPSPSPTPTFKMITTLPLLPSGPSSPLLTLWLKRQFWGHFWPRLTPA